MPVHIPRKYGAMALASLMTLVGIADDASTIAPYGSTDSVSQSCTFGVQC